MNSRAKGKAGELECAAFLREHGFDARRGRQFQGGADSPDVIGLPGCHVEVKRVEKGSLYDWLAQAMRDAPKGKTPVVLHRRNREKWVALLPAEAFLALLNKSLSYDPDADAIGSYFDAIKAIGDDVKSGKRPVPTDGYFGSAKG